MSRISYTLKEPVAFAGEQITEMSLRQPKTRDLKAAYDPNPITMQANLLSRLAAQPMPVIDELSVDDYAALAELTANFPKGSPATGES